MDKKQAEIEKILLEHEKEAFKELKKSYTNALADIKGRVLHLQNSLAELNGIDTTGYDKESLEILQSMKRSKIYQLNYQKALEDQISACVDVLKKDTVTNLQTFLGTMYQDSYLGNLYNLNAKGIPLTMPINPSLLANSVNKKIDGMTFGQRVNVNMNDFKKTVKAEISRGIANGSTYSEIAQQLSMATGEDLNKTMRIVRTEGGRVSSEARLTSMRDAREKGADLVKQWDSTLDHKTRPTHAELDQQIREIDEPFQVAGMEAMYPHGFGLASEDINCRCVMLSVPRWDIQESNVRYNNEKDELIETKNYADWKQGYYRRIAEEELQERTIDYFKGFVEAKTIKEAEKYAQEILGTLINPYKGLDIRVANELNKTLTYYQNAYPEVMENISCIGNYQEINKLKKETKYYYYLDYLRKENPKLTRYQIEELAKRFANNAIRKVSGNTVATSFSALKDEMKMYNGIYINQAMGKDYDELLRILKGAEDIKFHPIGTGNLKAIIDHEVGHQLDTLLGIYNEKNIQDLYKNTGRKQMTEGLSEYAWNNNNYNKYSEMIAEGWAEYLNNPNPRPMAKEIGETIERKYAEWIKKNSSKK